MTYVIYEYQIFSASATERHSFEVYSSCWCEFKISYEDVISGKEQTILIKGKSGHPHHVLITADVLLALRTTQIVEVDSTTDAGHSHIVRITREPV